MKRDDGFSARSILAHAYGPMDFWQGVSELSKSRGRRDFYTWEEWDEFFALAEQFGMTAFSPKSDGTVNRFQYGPIGIALIKQWRRVRAARAEGISPQQFHFREQKLGMTEEQRRSLHEEEERATRAHRRESAKVREETAQTRHFTPRVAAHVEDDGVTV